MSTSASTAQVSSTALNLEPADFAGDGESWVKLRKRVFARRRRGTTIALDVSRATCSSMQELAVLARLEAEAEERGLALTYQGLKPELLATLRKARHALLSDEEATKPDEPVLERVGELALMTAHDITTMRHYTADVLKAIFLDPLQGRPWRMQEVVEQLDQIGVKGIAITAFISILIGTVLALNGAQELRAFGASLFTANLVGVSMTREMGPLISAVLVAGRSGSAIAAELGTMVVNEELDALQTMALPPTRFLLAPRIIALIISLPCLTVMADVFGIFGGYLVGSAALHLGSVNWMRQTEQSLLISDILAGLVKSGVFALLIGLISCYEGITVSGGAQGVGSATTRAVVNSIIAAIAADAVFTLFFFLG